jgi:hypothetical protein
MDKRIFGPPACVATCDKMVTRRATNPQHAYFEARRLYALARGLPMLPTVVDPRTLAIVENIVAILAAFHGTTPDRLHVMDDNGQGNFLGAEVFTEGEVRRTFEANLTALNACPDQEFAFYTHDMAVYAFVSMATQLCPIEGSYVVVANVEAIEQDIGRRTDATMHLMDRLGLGNNAVVLSREDARNIATERGVFGALGVAGVVRMVDAIRQKDVL